MKRFRARLCLVALLVSGCAARGPACTLEQALVLESGCFHTSPIGFRHIEGRALESQDVLLAIDTENEGTNWYIVDPCGPVLVLPSPPLSMGHVRGISASPDGKLLAVISAGEGHPMLDVLDLPSFLDGDSKKAPLLTIDPFPGVIMISIPTWDGGSLRVWSDRPINRISKETGRVPPWLELEHLEEFRIDIGTGEIRPLGENARDPVRYFRKRLADKDGSISDAAFALAWLKAYEALPDLRALEACTEDPGLRADLHTAVEELEAAKRAEGAR
jgi:hypothetical protein